MMLGVIVTQVLEAGMPMDTELLAGNLISNPEVAHFHGARSLAFDSVVGNAGGGCVVTVDCGRWLGVTEFVKDEPNYTALFGVDK